MPPELEKEFPMYGQYDPYVARLLSGERYEGENGEDDRNDLPTAQPVDAEVVWWSLVALTALALPLLVWAIMLG
ncbi:MAG: hypothetical protein INF52_15130 [Rhodobacter sp.]|nr:hypothetical protein [Rhodobacter sp.]